MLVKMRARLQSHLKEMYKVCQTKQYSLQISQLDRQPFKNFSYYTNWCAQIETNQN